MQQQVATKPARRGKWLMAIGFLLLLFSVAPLISAFSASWLAEAHGCTLHEGFANPCVFWGADRGSMLYDMFVMGWLMLLTIWFAPIGLILMVIGFILFLRNPKPPVPAPVEHQDMFT